MPKELLLQERRRIKGEIRRNIIIRRKDDFC